MAYFLEHPSSSCREDVGNSSQVGQHFKSTNLRPLANPITDRDLATLVDNKMSSIISESLPHNEAYGADALRQQSTDLYW